MPIVDIGGKAVEFPDDLSGDALNDAVGKAAQQMGISAPRSTGEQVARGVGLFGKGINDAVGATVGAPFDLANWALKQPAKLLPDNMRDALPDLPAAGFYGQKVAGALNAVGRNDTPENLTEKIAYGAGQGVGNAGSVMLPAGLVAKGAQAGSMTQGIASTLAAQPGMQLASGAVGGAVGQATDNPWLGAAASLAVPLGASVARGVISPGGVRPNEETRRLIEVAKAEGIPLTPGQVTGSRPLRTTESVFATLPSTAGKAEQVADAQRKAFNSAVLERMGVQGETRATTAVVNSGLDDAGQRMQSVYAKHDWQADAPTMRGVLDIAREAKRELTKDSVKPLLNRVEDLIDKVATSGGTYQVEGKAFGALDSALSRELRTTTDGKTVDYLGRLQRALRDAYQAALPADDAELLATARRHYANGMLIEKAMNAPNVNTTAGNVPPASLSQALATGPRHNYAKGRGDLNDLVRVGRAFIQDAVPNSGTPERMMIMNLLTGGMAGGGALAGGVEGAALGMAGALAGPRIAQSAYLSPWMQNYLTNQAADKIIPRPNAGLLGAITAGQSRGLLDR